ncbi:MerR family transcriptional regulator [Exilibacterium tricleocarpae]|uniref:MerR family transcriptional regulator n=1 Tax=Exilibacterium tricleocarpae TaxID=2591008 RepID=A0A545TVS1_9GAMM|nr:MerR family transcriptional regulator [Exilibacterium tricleocarpae]TQV81313.1 MerR family transcriptional regulator [Exilibacterium tricleocarpae]
MYSIGQLVKEFSVSRSTLLYYDKIGLLKPSGRSTANYRQYTQRDFDRMAQIATYKEAGLPLDSIAEILDSSNNEPSEILEKRLRHLNSEISRIRQQQQLIIRLLGKRSLLKTTKVMNKQQWVKILRASGMDDQAMRQWHIEFERDLPEVHSDFLESLGIDKKEIAEIKAFSQN